jgi:hypothetical protein
VISDRRCGPHVDAVVRAFLARRIPLDGLGLVRRRATGDERQAVDWAWGARAPTVGELR